MTALPEQQGILVDDHDDVTIRNCQVTNPLNGIAVVGLAERTQVVGNSAFANANAGIAADDAVDTQILGNTTTRNAGNGIQVIDATGALVADNTSSENDGMGIGTAHASGSVFRNNALAHNAWYGLALGSNSHDDVVRDNLAVGNSDIGFSVWRSPDDRLIGNIARENAHGFGISLSGGNRLVGNVTRASEEAGFFLYRSSGTSLRLGTQPSGTATRGSACGSPTGT